MSDAENNPQLPDDRKSRIVKIATSLFANFGFNGVSIRKISEACDCNLAAISYYFGGKEKLYSECLKAIDPEFVKEFDDILGAPSDQKDLESRLFLFCRFTCQFVSLNAGAMKLLINEMNSKNKNVEDLDDNFVKPILTKLDHFFSEAMNRGIINPDIEVKIISRMVFTTIVTQILFKSFGPYDEISLQEFSEKLIRTITRSFYV